MIVPVILLAQYFLLAQSKMILENEFVEIVHVDEDYVKINTFHFYKKTRTFAALNVTFTTFMDVLDNDTKIQMTAYQFRNNEYKKTVIELNVGLCQLYKQNAYGAKTWLGQSNIRGCPFYKGDYYMYDAAPELVSLPPFFPEGKWMIESQLFFGDIKIATIHWMMAVKKSIKFT